MYCLGTQTPPKNQGGSWHQAGVEVSSYAGRACGGLCSLAEPRLLNWRAPGTPPISQLFSVAGIPATPIRLEFIASFPGSPSSKRNICMTFYPRVENGQKNLVGFGT